MQQLKSVPQAVFETASALASAAKGHKEAVDVLNRTPAHMLGEGNPNHPRFSGIFGEETAPFIARQYKKLKATAQ